MGLSEHAERENKGACVGEMGVVPFFGLYPQSHRYVDGYAFTEAKKGPPLKLRELLRWPVRFFDPFSCAVC